MLEARLVADVERLIVARENESESLLEAILSANIDIVSVTRKNESNHCVKQD